MISILAYSIYGDGEDYKRQLWKKIKNLVFFLVKSEMLIKTPKWRCQEGSWLNESVIQKKVLVRAAKLEKR